MTIPVGTIPVGKVNDIVLDYLVVNGYREAAEQFVSEAGLGPIDGEDISTRRTILNLLKKGDIINAIDMLNELDATYLDNEPATYYLLLEMQLIELIRNANAELNLSTLQPALDFAETRLLPLVQQQPQDKQQEFTKKFEQVMALLCFTQQNMPPSLKELMSIERRINTANEVHRSLLEWKGRSGTSRLCQILKLRRWAVSIPANS